jgi:hypothetical protein
MLKFGILLTLFAIFHNLLLGNVSSENLPLRANYGNFNLSQTMLIQRRAHGSWEG